MAKGDILDTQNDNSGGLTTATIAFASTPTAGDLLVFFAANQTGSDTITGPSGGTQAFVSPGTEWPKIAAFVKIASGSENSFTVTSTSSTQLTCISYRIEGSFSDLTGVSGVADPTSFAATVETKKIIATDQSVDANTLVFAAIGLYEDKTGSLGSWTNSFANATAYFAISTLGVARRVYASSATDVSTTPTWTGNDGGNCGLVFVELGGTSIVPQAMANYRMRAA